MYASCHCQAGQCKVKGISIYSSKFRAQALRQKSLHWSVQSHLYWESCEIVRHLWAEERTIHGTKLLIIENYLIIHNCRLIISSFQLERRSIDQISLRFAQLQLWLSGQLLLNEYGHIQFISCISFIPCSFLRKWQVSL